MFVRGLYGLYIREGGEDHHLIGGRGPWEGGGRGGKGEVNEDA